MKKLLPVLFLLILSTTLLAQVEAGKIITHTEAKSLFGEANIQIKIQSSLLLQFAENSKNLLITIIDQNLLVADQDKKMLFPEDYTLNGKEQFHLYSSSVVQDLLKKAEQEYVLVELRGDILTITNNDYTLEYGMLCPPYCY